MSDSGITKEILELTKEKKRELQYSTMKAWEKGRMTGRECIESIVDLENVLVLDMEEIDRIRSSGGPTNFNPENKTD